MGVRRTMQREIEFPQWGGVRRGAGRKRTTRRRRVPHVARERHVQRHPLHVTLRLADGLPSLRADRAHAVVRGALRDASDRLGLRVIHYSAQTDHLHLVCEATDQRALARGMKGLAVRLARALNRLWNRAGAVLGDRYHVRALKSPREVRFALAYVLGNARKHGLRLATLLDPCSSAECFDGWGATSMSRPSILARATTWLLAKGWRLHGPLDPHATPG